MSQLPTGQAPQTICILGAGAWGTALAMAAARNHTQVHLWGHDAEHIQHMQHTRCNDRYLDATALPDNLHLHTDLASATAASSNILIVVPSHAFDATLAALAQLPNKMNFNLAWGTKGIDPHSHEWLQQRIQHHFSHNTPLALLSGPSFALEVAHCLPTTLTVASEHPTWQLHLQKMLQQPSLRIETTSDIRGVQLMGCVKNVFAILMGICDGIGWQDNARAAIFTLIVQEAHRLLVELAGGASSLVLAAGIGDLYLTCCNEQSRNHKFGRLIGELGSVTAAQQQLHKLVEGYHTCKQLHVHILRKDAQFTVIHAVYKILYEQQDPQQALKMIVTPRT